MAKYASSETTRMLPSAVKERVVEERVYQLQPLLSSQVYVWAYMVVRQSNAWSQTQVLFPFPPILLSNLLFLSSCRSSKCYTGLNVEFFLGRQQRNSLLAEFLAQWISTTKKKKKKKSVCSQTVMRFIIWTLFWAEKLKKKYSSSFWNRVSFQVPPHTLKNQISWKGLYVDMLHF